MLTRPVIGHLLIASALLAACGSEPTSPVIREPVTAATFPDAWATTWCRRQQECAAGDFASRWVDDKALNCKRTKSEEKDFKTDWSDLVCGDFHATGAQACLDAMDTMSCEAWTQKDWRTACRAVYGC